MSALTFTLKIVPRQRIDLSPLTPDLLAGLPLDAIAAIALHSGKQMLRTDTVFDISGNDASQMIIRNSCAKLDYIGRHLKSGSIHIHGDAGAYLGYQMRHGEIQLHGNAEAYAASGMAGGLLHIHGNTGDYLAAAIVGDRKGMKGGVVIVTGNAGDRVGDQMRRGMLLIEGNVGDYCASRMLAGTIGVLGNSGRYLGFGMRRGTVLLTAMPALHVTIQDCGMHTLPYLNLMYKDFAAYASRFAQLRQNRIRRFAGDIANDGKGEILVLEPLSA